MHITTSLRTRFAITFAVLIIMLTSLISFIIGHRSTRDVKVQIGNSLAETAFQMSAQLDHYMWARSGEIDVLSELDILKNPTTKASVQEILDKVKKSFPSYAWIGLTDAKGVIFASTNGILSGVDISSRPVFQQALKGSFVGDVHDAVLLSKLLPNPSGEPMKFVDISTPIMGPDGNISGILASHLSWEWAQEIEQTIIKPLRNRKQLDLFIISSIDNVVLLGPKDSIGQTVKLSSISKAHSGDNNWTVETWQDGKSYLTGYAFGDGYQNYKGLGWTVLVRQPETLAYASVKSLQNFILLLGGVLTVLFAIVGWFLAGHIAAPLKQITVAANRLKSGEKIEIPYLKGITDIEVLSSSLRELVNSLSRTEHALGNMQVAAHNDKLTGLPNRLALEQYINNVTMQAQQNSTILTFLYLDLDGFKLINDTYGHHTGDLLLMEVANRLKKIIHPWEIVARLGGDEFVMILFTPPNSIYEHGKLIGDKIISDLSEPYIIDNNTMKVGCSIGCALFPFHGNDPSDVLCLSDEALYTAKRTDKNRVFFYNNPNA